MFSRRWNPALRHTVLGEPGNEGWLESRSKGCAACLNTGYLKKKNGDKFPCYYGCKPKQEQK